MAVVDAGTIEVDDAGEISDVVDRLRELGFMPTVWGDEAVTE